MKAFFERLLNQLKAEVLFLKDNLAVWYEDAKQSFDPTQQKKEEGLRSR